MRVTIVCVALVWTVFVLGTLPILHIDDLLCSQVLWSQSKSRLLTGRGTWPCHYNTTNTKTPLLVQLSVPTWVFLVITSGTKKFGHHQVRNRRSNRSRDRREFRSYNGIRFADAILVCANLVLIDVNLIPLWDRNKDVSRDQLAHAQHGHVTDSRMRNTVATCRRKTTWSRHGKQNKMATNTSFIDIVQLGEWRTQIYRPNGADDIVQVRCTKGVVATGTCLP